MIRHIGSLGAFQGPQRKATLILLTSSPLMLAWKYYASPAFLNACFPAMASQRPEAAAIIHFLSATVLMGLLPAAVVVWWFRESLRDYGVSLGIPVRTFRTMLMLVPLFAIAGYLGAVNPELRAKFPINPTADASLGAFLIHAATYFCYYVGWEFYFRGFLLFGLRETTGETNAVLIQTLASALLHIGSPAGETFGAIAGGVLWGVLALRTRSILSGMLQHFALGITLDARICFG